MKNSAPWDDLYLGKARRIDRDSYYDFFWAIVQNNQVALVLSIPSGTTKIEPLPRIKSLNMSYNNFGDRHALVISLKDSEHKDLFAILCEDMVSAGEKGKDISDALALTINRAHRWQYLMRTGSSRKLGLEDQQGLIGELHILKILCQKVGPEIAIEAWQGPNDSSKDFELFKMCIEAKTHKKTAKPYINISSENQLADVQDTDTYLAVMDIDGRVNPKGMTLTDHVQSVEELFRYATAEAYLAWEQRLEATGFDWEQDYTSQGWEITGHSAYQVKDDFPRLVPPIHIGVSNVKYSIALDALNDFRIEEHVFLDRINESLSLI